QVEALRKRPRNRGVRPVKNQSYRFIRLASVKGFWLLSALLLFCALRVQAGVIVTQNVSPGATNWPGVPMLISVTNPAAQATVAESFNGGGNNTNLSQTFTVSGSSFFLETINLYAGAGTGTGTTNMLLGLYDLDAQLAPNP